MSTISLSSTTHNLRLFFRLSFFGPDGLIYSVRPDLTLNSSKDSFNKDQLNPHTSELSPFEYKYRGGVYNSKDIQELLRYNEASRPRYRHWRGFGDDALLGLNETLGSRSLLVQKNGNHMVLEDVFGIVVAGNGYVAYISQGFLSPVANGLTL